MSKLKNLTQERLAQFLEDGHTDISVGKFFGVSGEAIGYWRKKWGLKRSEHVLLRSTATETLGADYYSMTSREFSRKYKVSKTVWLPYLKSLGVISKAQKRTASYPPLTGDQTALVVGSLLGDGAISKEGRYYESHSLKQKAYLDSKRFLLRPFSRVSRPDGDCLSFCTVSHPIFFDLRSKFYAEGVEGKLIPVDYIRQVWDDRILAYWFLDDGCFEDSTGSFSISNKCPDRNQLYGFVDFLESRFGWGFHVTPTSSVFLIHMSNSYAREMSELIKRVATPDMYYKIPEQFLTAKMVNSSMNESFQIRPKYYRLATQEIKTSIEQSLFEDLRERGFPYLKLSVPRCEYVLDQFKKFPVGHKDGVIGYSTVGMNLCESFFPNIYKARRKGRRAPLEDWYDDAFLRRLVHNRLKYADRVTAASIRTGVKLLSSCVSNFKPSVARFVYRKFAMGGNVLDYSAGYGARMLGAMIEGCYYTAVEPNSETASNLVRFGDFLQPRTGGQYMIIRGGSESADLGTGYGLAFSSPPYFDHECYSQEDNQSTVRYPAYDEWLTKYWFLTLRKCHDSLVDGGFFAVCLSPFLVPDMITDTVNQCSKLGLVPWEDFIVPTKGVLAGGDRSEILMMFKKGASPKSFRFVGKELSQAMPRRAKPHAYRTAHDFDKAKKLFREKAPVIGTSRDAYKDGSTLGVPSHAIEHYFGSWNNFIRECGLEPQYEARLPSDHTRDYLEACRESGTVLSFYAYEKRTGKPSTRLKRIFNSGRPYHHLITELKAVALNPDLWQDFLKKIE